MTSRVRSLAFALASLLPFAAPAAITACGSDDDATADHEGGATADGGGGNDGSTSFHDATTGGGGDAAPGSEGGPVSDASSTTDAMSLTDATQATDGAPAGDAAGSCTAPGYTTAANPIVPGTVTATIVDTNGLPLSGFSTIIIGLDIASQPDSTSGSGAVSITFGTTVNTPYFTYGDALTYARLLTPVTANQAEGTLTAIALPATGATLTAGTTATSGPLSVTTAAGASISINTLVYTTPSQQELRAVSMTLAQAKLDPSFDQAFGVAPDDTILCPPAKVSVPNRNAIPAGTAVDFYVLGDDTGQDWAKFGQFTVIASGHVSADGTAIVTDDATGLPILGSLATKRH